MPGSRGEGPGESATTESMRVGGVCALVGLAGVGAVSVVRPDPGVGRLLVAAALAAFLSATFCWALFVAPRPTASRVRVALVMAGAAILGHLLTWTFFSVTISPGTYVERPSELLKVPVVALIFGAASLIVIGWLTVPLGIGVGLLFHRRRTRPAPLFER